jgi:hypothetical protein
VQTLEPRAFYVYVPYRNQSQAPTFDTAVDDFNFGQLFSVNRYLGNDRIGDANQLTLALTSRFLDPNTGAERLRVAVGQRYYFNTQRVVLNESPRSAASSDVLVGAEGRLSDAWSIAALWQYNQDSRQTERLNAGFRYTPAPGPGLQCELHLLPPIRRPGRPAIAAEPVRPVVAVARQSELDVPRPVEFLAPRQQDAGGGGRRRVQCRLLGTPARRPATGDDLADDDQFGLSADRIERIGAVRD